MPLTYDPTTSSGALRQGEIIGGVSEHQAAYPPVPLPENSTVPIETVTHPRLIVMTADCDLLWDYRQRSEVSQQSASIGIARDHPSLMTHILLCELYEQTELRGRGIGNDIWRRISQNQDERYHHLSAAAVGNPPVSELPDLYLDFKKMLSLPTHRLYEGLDRSLIIRIAVMPPIYLHDLMHRFYSFLGRVGLPE